MSYNASDQLTAISEVDDDEKEQAVAKEKKTMINDILKVPEVKQKKRMEGAHMQGLP